MQVFSADLALVPQLVGPALAMLDPVCPADHVKAAQNLRGQRLLARTFGLQEIEVPTLKARNFAGGCRSYFSPIEARCPDQTIAEIKNLQ